MAIRTFEMYRTEDETGISGSGKVLEGTIFSDGECIIRWISAISPGHSTAIFDSFGSFLSIHVSPHPDNKSEIRFNDGEVYANAEKIEEQTVVEPAPKPRRRKAAVSKS
jgi:hypothetical protein